MSEKSELCTADEAGGWGNVDPSDERAYLRLFRTCTPMEIREAVDALVRHGHPRRPAPNELAQRITQLRRARACETRNPEPWPEVTPEYVRGHLDKIRQQNRASVSGRGRIREQALC